MLGRTNSGLARLAASAAVVVGSFGLQGNVAQAAGPFTVTNPYAYGLSDDQIAINKLIAFGDSYSSLNRRPFPNWVEQLEAETNTNGAKEVKSVADFAKSGATAGTYPGDNNNFARQVKLWLGTSPVLGPSDLTVVYLGYNDIDGGTDKTGADLSNAQGDYKAGLKKLIANGANKNGRRLLLVMPHNWGRDPAFKKAGAQTMRLRTIVWDNFVAKTASSFSATYGGNIIAVDLFTTFEQVFNHPDDFCFQNVTDTAPSTTAWQKYLFDVPGSNGTGGEFHFGPRGQNLIEQVMQYYLTRGWDWANTTKDPAAAKNKLNADLAAGKVFSAPCQQVTGAASAQAPARAAGSFVNPPTGFGRAIEAAERRGVKVP